MRALACESQGPFVFLIVTDTDDPPVPPKASDPEAGSGDSDIR